MIHAAALHPLSAQSRQMDADPQISSMSCENAASRARRWRVAMHLSIRAGEDMPLLCVCRRQAPSMRGSCPTSKRSSLVYEGSDAKTDAQSSRIEMMRHPDSRPTSTMSRSSRIDAATLL